MYNMMYYSDILWDIIITYHDKFLFAKDDANEQNFSDVLTVVWI